MRNPISWLVDRFAMKASPIACATPHVWAAEQRQAAEWALADTMDRLHNRRFFVNVTMPSRPNIVL